MNFVIAQYDLKTWPNVSSSNTDSMIHPILGSHLPGTFPSLSPEARLVRAIREALNWSGRTDGADGRGPPSPLPPSLSPAAGTMAISSRAELSQMEDEQITRIKKEGGGRRIGGRSAAVWHKW